MKKICINQQTFGSLLRNLQDCTPLFFPTLASAMKAGQRGKRCAACEARHASGISIFKAFICDIKTAKSRGVSKDIEAYLNKTTNNEITTRWEFISGNEVIAL